MKSKLKVSIFKWWICNSCCHSRSENKASDFFLHMSFFLSEIVWYWVIQLNWNRNNLAVITWCFLRLRPSQFSWNQNMSWEKKTVCKQSVSFYSILSFRVESLQFQFVSNFDQIKVQNRYYEKLLNQKIFGHSMPMALTAEKWLIMWLFISDSKKNMND